MRDDFISPMRDDFISQFIQLAEQRPVRAIVNEKGPVKNPPATNR